MKRQKLPRSVCERILTAKYGPAIELREVNHSPNTKCRLIGFPPCSFIPPMEVEFAVGRDWDEVTRKVVSVYDLEQYDEGRIVLSDLCGRLYDQRKARNCVEGNR